VLGKTPVGRETLMAKPLLNVLAGQATHPTPIWLMRQAGRYLPEYRKTRAKAASFLEFCFTPDLAVEASLQPIRRFGLDGAILFSDILVLPHALGRRVAFVEGKGPVLEPLRHSHELDRLTPQAVRENLAAVFETLHRLRQELPKDVTLIGFAGAPWTVACYMVEGEGSRDFQAARRLAYREPALFARLIDILSDATIDYLSAQIEAGAETLQIFDSWAGSLAEAELRRWSLEPLTRIVAALKLRHPEVPVILFPRGAGVLYQEFALASGAAAFSLDSSLPLAWAAEELQQRTVLQGNLDPLLLLEGGDAMRKGAERILRVLGNGPFVFNLGHGILPDTPPEHVAELVDLVRGWKASTTA
jgi:uroporphyrinogen decarboxylase